MLYDDLKEREDKFHRTLKDAYGDTFTTSEGTQAGTVRLSKPGEKWYYAQRHKKDKIVIHFTAGVLHGDIGELTRSHVSVAYVLARDGTIYELFNPKFWSFHLGRGATGGNTKNSKASIGIEISNYGPLTLDKENNILKTWSGKSYCTLEQVEAYVHVEGGYRGSEYFASYTDAQYRKLDSLITNLCREHGILRKLPSKDQRGKKLRKIGKGIWSHENFREGKSDVGPAFDWARISGR